MQAARHAILDALARGGLQTARDLAKRLSWGRRRASMAALRAHRCGLVSRRMGVYGLTAAGARRLAWVESEAL